jgi:hypothetical protein
MALLSRENLRSVTIALILLGLLALGFGGVRFVMASQAREANYAYLQRAKGDTLQLSEEQARVLFSADMELRTLERQRNEGAIFIGVGVALVALGWLGGDLLRKKPVALPAGHQSAAKS